MKKRVFDVFLSVFLLVVLSPILIALYLTILFFLGRPVIFKQVRPGKDCKPFVMVKFRTMIDLFDDDGNLLPDSERMTPFGRFLRSTSLDELPELWNIVKGNMSFVGPRPLLMEYLSLYTEEQNLRHNVRPGVTGWAQINGRNAITWDERFDLDIWYVKNQSFFLDLKILFHTISKVIKREGISAQGEVTMSKFTGKSK